MTVAIITNTPEPMIWNSYTIGMIYQRLRRLRAVMPFFGLAERDGDVIDVDHDPRAALAYLSSLGLPRSS